MSAVKNPFKDKKLSKLLVRFSAPAVAGMFANALYNIISRIYVGQDVGAEGLAAITLLFPLGLIYMGFSALIGVGSNALFSIRLGEKRTEEARYILGNGFILLTLVSGVITVLSYVFLDPILSLLGADAQVLPFARAYAEVVFPGYLLFGIGAGMNHFIRSSGRPKTAMATQLIGAFINLVFGPIFIFTLHWGIRGAAAATVLGQAISFLWVMWFFIRGNTLYRLRLNYCALKKRIVLGCMAIGFSQFAFQLASSALNFILNHALLRYGGNVAVSSMGIAISVNTLILMPLLGISQGAQPLIGYNHGARKYKTAIQTLKMALRWSMWITTTGFVIIELFAVPIAAVFNSTDTVLVAMASRTIRILNIFLPILPLQIMATSFFQAINQPLKAALLSLSRQVLLVIPLVFILPLFFKLDGVFLAPVVADAIATMLAVYMLHRFFAKHGLTLFLKKK
ncbi:MAG: MATE family efflux transporter [Elusimicrobiaceae bacterium]|nr:MATE family efflux transporter [Elusimicrobiaceae bacterium]